VYYRDLTAAAAFAIAFVYRFVALLVALALTAVVFVALARRAFERRLKALLDRIRDVERGSWLASSGVSDSWKEFRRIGEAFALMAERVAEREEDLRRSEEKYRGLFVRNKAPTLIIDGGSGRIVDANPAAALFYGRDRDSLLSMNIQEINTLDSDEIAAEMAEAEEERRSHFHFRHRLADGQLRDVEVYSSPVEWDGARRLYSIIIDVTERSLAEKRVERSLAEKEVLLREVHHRVKNNLQIMASLLNLQALYVRDPEDADLFHSSQNRILSMAAIHELLYQRDDLAAVDLGEYLRSLIGNLSETASRGRIEISVETERAQASPEKALPLGLITNELVTNSIKYAFPLQEADSKPRSIAVSLHRREDNIELEIRDNGVGLPSDVDPESASSLGFSLVRSLGSQLGGHITYCRTDGFSVVITAPLV
jgi:PAS domain S-box-containing protein